MAILPTLIQPAPDNLVCRGVSSVGWWSPAALELDARLVTVATPVTTPTLLVAGFNSFMLLIQAAAPPGAGLAIDVQNRRPIDNLAFDPTTVCTTSVAGVAGSQTTWGAFSPATSPTSIVWWLCDLVVSTDSDCTITAHLFGGRR